MDNSFFTELPKIELHAHLNGSLSQFTILELKRYHADLGLEDKTNVFFDEFQIGAGDRRSLADCFQLFNIAHTLTTTPDALALATRLTLKEFQDDGCIYLELRSTPKDTPHMTKTQYIETILEAIKTANLTMITRLIVSINRSSPVQDAECIINIAIEYYKKYPDIVVGVELSGDPTAGSFKMFVPALNRARAAGLKITLHCAEIAKPEEVLEMLEYKPERIGHGTCIHPACGGNEATWAKLCDLKIPVELCLTSNIKSKSSLDYESHHFKHFYETDLPLIICTDDKGVFDTSLSREYQICAETFDLTPSQIAKLALNACQYVFDSSVTKSLNKTIVDFIGKQSL